MKLKVSELIVRYMERLGIESIFGMPGAHILPVYDSLYDSRIQTILAKHEQGAAFMAGGLAQTSGKISACITTAGPGATNLVTGIANAYADKLPVLAITGETSTHIFGKGGLQESSGEGGAIDQSELFRGITRYNKIVERTDYLGQVLNQASRILLSPTSGPVLLSFPFNVQKEMVDDTILDEVVTETQHHSGLRESPTVGALARLLAEAEQPVIVAGYGCLKSGAGDLVRNLSESLNIPVTTSLKGKGIMDEQSPLSLGTLGVTSYSHAYRYIATKADLVVFLGASFNERTSYLWNKHLLQDKKIAQVDADLTQLEKVFTADLAIHGDIREVLSGMARQLESASPKTKPNGNPQPIAPNPGDQPDDSDAAIFQSRFPLVKTFFASLTQHFPSNTLFFDDNIIFAQNFLDASPGNRYYPNSGISSLGHAIPAAIGARFSTDNPIFAILGDGGFQMCCMEIMTAVNYQIPLNVVIFNNSTMGLIRKNQFQQYRKRFISCDFVNPDFQQLAASFGANHIKITSDQEVDALFANNDLTNGINLIEILIDKDAFPNYISGR